MRNQFDDFAWHVHRLEVVKAHVELLGQGPGNVLCGTRLGFDQQVADHAFIAGVLLTQRRFDLNVGHRLHLQQDLSQELTHARLRGRERVSHYGFQCLTDIGVLPGGAGTVPLIHPPRKTQLVKIDLMRWRADGSSLVIGKRSQAKSWTATK